MMVTTSRTTARSTLLSKIVDVRPEERTTVILMFAYAFAAMTAYNIVKPICRDCHSAGPFRSSTSE